MTEDIRISMDARRRLNWPRRCSRCGATDGLVWLDVRAGRRGRPLHERVWDWKSPRDEHGSYRTNGEQSLPIPVPMCKAHARSNQLGGLLLCPDDGMRFMRLAVYFSFGWLAQFTIYAITSCPDPFAEFAARSSTELFTFAYAAIGAAALVWADCVAWIRPLQLDHQRESADLRFRNTAYAISFRRMNPTATWDAPASGLAPWLRPTPAKVLGLVLLAVIACSRAPGFAGP